MTKAETIEYAIKKECQSYSLVRWCESWGITVDEFYKFLELGKKAFEALDMAIAALGNEQKSDDSLLREDTDSVSNDLRQI